MRLLCASLEGDRAHRRLPRGGQPPGVAAQPRRGVDPDHGRDLPPERARPAALRHAERGALSKSGAPRGAPARPGAYMPATARSGICLKRPGGVAVSTSNCPVARSRSLSLLAPNFFGSTPACRACVPKAPRQYQPCRLSVFSSAARRVGSAACGFAVAGFALLAVGGGSSVTYALQAIRNLPPRCRTHRRGALPGGCGRRDRRSRRPTKRCRSRRCRRHAADPWRRSPAGCRRRSCGPPERCRAAPRARSAPWPPPATGGTREVAVDASHPRDAEARGLPKDRLGVVMRNILRIDEHRQTRLRQGLVQVFPRGCLQRGWAARARPASPANRSG